MQAVCKKDIKNSEILADKISVGSLNVFVDELLENRISEAVEAIEKTEGLTIDGVLEDGSIKVINENLKEAFSVSIDAIVFTPVKDLIEALKTSVFEHVYSVTRIVGYYSRISGWNASKIGELRDRMKGNYWEGIRVNSEKSRIFDVKQTPTADHKFLSVK